MPAYKFTISDNSKSITESTPLSFEFYRSTSSPVLTSAMIPYIQRFLDVVGLSATLVASVSAAVDSLDSLGV